MNEIDTELIIRLLTSISLQAETQTVILQKILNNIERHTDQNDCIVSHSESIASTLNCIEERQR